MKKRGFLALSMGLISLLSVAWGNVAMALTDKEQADLEANFMFDSAEAFLEEQKQMTEEAIQCGFFETFDYSRMDSRVLKKVLVDKGIIGAINSAQGADIAKWIVGPRKFEKFTKFIVDYYSFDDATLLDNGVISRVILKPKKRSSPEIVLSCEVVGNKLKLTIQAGDYHNERELDIGECSKWVSTEPYLLTDDELARFDADTRGYIEEYNKFMNNHKVTFFSSVLYQKLIGLIAGRVYNLVRRCGENNRSLSYMRNFRSSGDFYSRLYTTQNRECLLDAWVYANLFFRFVGNIVSKVETVKRVFSAKALESENTPYLIVGCMKGFAELLNQYALDIMKDRVFKSLSEHILATYSRSDLLLELRDFAEGAEAVLKY